MLRKHFIHAHGEAERLTLSHAHAGARDEAPLDHRPLPSRRTAVRLQPVDWSSTLSMRMPRCYNAIDLVNHLEAELCAGRQGRTEDQLSRRDFVILDELSYLAFDLLAVCRKKAAETIGETFGLAY